jgi:hypothetical protein
MTTSNREFQHHTLSPRRFRPPWSVEELDAHSSVCDERVDNPDNDESHDNEYPIGSLNARYRCCPAKPVHGFPPRVPLAYIYYEGRGRRSAAECGI